MIRGQSIDCWAIDVIKPTRDDCVLAVCHPSQASAPSYALERPIHGSLDEAEDGEVAEKFTNVTITHSIQISLKLLSFLGSTAALCEGN